MTSNYTILFWLPLRIFDSSWFLITLPAWGWRTKDNRRNILLNLIEVKPFYHPVNSRIAMKLSNLQILLLKQVFRKDYRLLLTDCRGLCFKIPQRVVLWPEITSIELQHTWYINAWFSKGRSVRHLLLDSEVSEDNLLLRSSIPAEEANPFFKTMTEGTGILHEQATHASHRRQVTGSRIIRLYSLHEVILEYSLVVIVLACFFLIALSSKFLKNNLGSCRC